MDTKEKKEWISTYGRTRGKVVHDKHGFNMTLQMLCQILINVKWLDSLLSHKQMDIWKNKSPFFCCSLKGHFLLICKLKNKFHFQKSIIILGVSNYKRMQKKKKSTSTFKSSRELTRNRSRSFTNLQIHQGVSPKLCKLWLAS